VPANPFSGNGGIAGNGTIAELATTIINILLGLSGIVAVVMIIIGGYQWMTARGNEAQVTNGRKTLINALIGLAIVILSFAVVQAVNTFLQKGI
jgi:predicted small integral membrane protein